MKRLGMWYATGGGLFAIKMVNAFVILKILLLLLLLLLHI